MSEKKRNFLKFIKSGTYTDKSGNRTNTDRAASRVKKIDLDLETMKPASTKKMLTGGQAAIAAKAPPPNKIDAKDFAVLRAEKAKGRGMGLQDESKKPGKIYKAKAGMSFSDKMKAVEKGLLNKKTGKPTSMTAVRDMKGYKPGESVSEFMKRKKELGATGKALSATRIGKIVLGVGAAGVAAQQYLKSKMKKKDEPKKKMGGGMMKKYSKGGGYDSGMPGKVRDVVTKYAGKMKSKDRLTSRDIELAKEAISRAGYKKASQGFLRSDPMPKKMGGGMMQKPMGYSKGVSVKARGCKLGRTKPTKIT